MMRFNTLLNVFLVGIFAVPPAGAAQPPLVSAHCVPEDRSSSIEGTITQAGSHLPAGGTFVYLRADDGITFVASGNADQQGNFCFAGLEPGTYKLLLDDFQYVAEVYDDHTCPFLRCDLEIADTITTTAGGLVHVDIDMARSGRFGGSLTDAATGKSVHKVGLRLIDATDGSPEIVRWQVAGGGSYSWGGVAPGGLYRVQLFSAPGYLLETWNDIPCPLGFCWVAEGDLIAFTGYEVISNIDFALRSAAIFLDDFESGDTTVWSAATD